MATANYVLLQRITLTADTTSVTLSSIPQTGYTDLKLVVSARGTGSSQYIKVAFNGDTTAGNYGQRQVSGNGSSVSSGSFARLIFEINRSSYTANTFANCEAYIPNYTGSQYKSYSADSANETNGTTAYMTMCAGIWNNTAAITSVNFTIDTGDSFVAGSSFSLYGIANAATTPLTAPKADGGDIIKTDGTYWYHAFLSTGSFKPQVNLTCDYLVVAGGGGGGGSASGNAGAGGGGAGGYRSGTNFAATATSYAITVGAGGIGNNRVTKPTKGSDSAFSTITSTGGGYGSSAGAGPASAGGSGGGGTADFVTGGSGNQGGYSPVEGYAGGTTISGSPYCGAGGGGATAAGGVGQTSSNGAGGAGSNALSSWATATGTGASGYYAGGGGGGGSNSGSGASTGGAGGGGAGSNSGVGTAGTPNTGGGGGGVGGGSSPDQNGYAGGNGGSGIVIIRYTVA